MDEKELDRLLEEDYSNFKYTVELNNEIHYTNGYSIKGNFILFRNENHDEFVVSGDIIIKSNQQFIDYNKRVMI